MKEVYVDATDLIVGRFASRVAKSAMLGDRVNILNCEKALISGRKHLIIKEWLHKRTMGTWAKGPFYPRMPDRFVRRIIRGMLSHRKTRGREAYERIKCHIGVPEKFKDKKLVSFDDASVSKLPTLKYIQVGELCKLLGAKL